MAHLVSLYLVVLAFACPPGDPGVVVVVGGDLDPIEFSIQTEIDYQLSYDDSRLALWFDQQQTHSAPPGMTFLSPPSQMDHGDMNDDAKVNGADVQVFIEVLLGIETDPVLFSQADFDENGLVELADISPFVVALLVGTPTGDVNRDGKVDGTDIQPFTNVLLNEYDPDADLDSSGVVDLADVPLFVEILLFGPTSSSSTITLFAEGLVPSGDLCDTPIDLLTDPEGDGIFALATTEGVTVVELTFNPLTGGLGTPITITMTPAIMPLAFDENTTAVWTGVFQPIVGDPSDIFQITYSAAQFHESSASQTILVVGDGTVTSVPDFENLEGSGAMPGMLTFHLTGLTLRRSFAFSLESDAAVWEQIDYPDGPGGLDPPCLDGEPEVLNAMLLSLAANPTTPSEDMLFHAGGFHIAAVVQIDENPTTFTDAPPTILVDLVSYDPLAVEIDRVENLVLNKVVGDNGDPDHIIYHNDLNVPIILVDIALNKADYPNVVILKIEISGTAVIVPAVD